jgi:GntR family transcriptional regulator, transcriptional repressor for pyruvate dehydrogenase complex
MRGIMLVPLKKARLYEEIIKQIKDLIQSGELKPGQKLPTERELVLQLNVSRTAIREALRSLEMMGFVESKVGEGTYIRQVTMDNVIQPFSGILLQNRKLIIELIDVRLLLEAEIARLAAQRINNEKAAAIENAVKLMEIEVKNGDIGLNGDNAFHVAIADAAENTAMSKILEMCGDLLSTTRKATLMIPGQPKKSILDHKKILAAIKAGDEEEAAELMREHLRKAHKNIEKE